MIRLFKWTWLLVSLSALLLVGVRVVGAHSRHFGQPAALAVLDPKTCPQPCWHDIRPGESTLDEAEQLLRAGRDFYYDRTVYHLRWTTATTPPWEGRAYRWSAFNDGSISYITLEPPLGMLRLGDAIMIFGDPIVASLCWQAGGSAPAGFPRPFLRAHVYFPGNVEVLAANPERPRELRYDPNMIVWSLMYSYPADEPPYAFDIPPWRGFVKTRLGQVC